MYYISDKFIIDMSEIAAVKINMLDSEKHDIYVYLKNNDRDFYVSGYEANEFMNQYKSYLIENNDG